MKKLNNKYKGWDSEEHLDEFNIWNTYSNYEFKFKWGSFLENKILNQVLKSKNDIKVIEVGCATGTTVRWLKLNGTFNNKNYTGIDLSGPTIKKAKKMYPGAIFKKVDLNYLNNLTFKYDYVFSRDTLMHQEKPLDFLDSLLSVSEKGLILRTRTKDNGKTEFDFEKSCQMHYNKYWMPYIVMNVNEILDFLSSFKFIEKVTINRSYEILGGHNYRFLPKDLYLKNAGGAETTIHIKIDRSKNRKKFKTIYTNIKEGRSLINEKEFKKYFFAIIRRLKII